MDTNIVDDILRSHFPNPPASGKEIIAFEERIGWRLDSDLRAFYERCNGASLFRNPNSTYEILPLDAIVRARFAVFGEDTDEWGPASWYVICSCQDGDWVAVDIERIHHEKYVLYDVDHGTFPDPRYFIKLADSFGEFLAKALRSNNRSYWLHEES